MKVVLNPGHAKDTPGKRSPIMADGKRLYEWEWNKEVAEIASRMLTKEGIDNIIARAEKEKESLTKPVKVCNDLCDQIGRDNVLFISIHVNAAGNGEWKNARGYSVWTTVGQTKSDDLATCIYNAATKLFKNQVFRKDMRDGDVDYEKDFYVIRKTKCPAVLIEHFFMDNMIEAEYLRTKECKERAAMAIVDGVKDYLNI